ncbi:hypothetical protein [Streptomyces sp. NPDC058249]|uniref:ATP-binding protein n=1 Tax=Streptomyces sp. NPDC058249 TaxID=3346403 RepID=UPI0036E07627
MPRRRDGRAILGPARFTAHGKHAATHSAEVRLAYSPGRLGITITDDGPAQPLPSPAPAGGYGLVGMRERPRSVGGFVRAGHRPQGGFEVVTELPLPHHVPEDTAAA